MEGPYIWEGCEEFLHLQFPCTKTGVWERGSNGRHSGRITAFSTSLCIHGVLGWWLGQDPYWMTGVMYVLLYFMLVEDLAVKIDLQIVQLLFEKGVPRGVAVRLHRRAKAEERV